jgi:hypothetical protein
MVPTDAPQPAFEMFASFVGTKLPISQDTFVFGVVDGGRTEHDA